MAAQFNQNPMEPLESLEKLVQSLTAAEKRQVTLLGRMRSGAPTSQHLALFTHICEAAPGQGLPADSPLHRNLPTSIARLRGLILDSLRLLHADRDPATTIATAIADIHNLLEKKQFQLAKRLLIRPKRLATDTARYTQSLTLLELERRLAFHTVVQGLPAVLAALAEEEEAILQRLRVLQRLRDAHERLRLYVRYIALPRDTQVEAQVQAIANLPELTHWESLPTYVEQALAINILGVQSLIRRDSQAAIARYAALLQDWQAHPDWIADQAPLLLLICNNFQTACFYSKLDWTEANRYLALVPDFNHLAPEVARDYQRMTLHNQLTPALNTGNLDFVQAFIPTVDAWIRNHEEHLGATQLLPFLHNIAVAKFLMMRFREANRYVQRILNAPDRKVRVDIRGFAIVLRSVLQYEIGDAQLNEYLTRSGRRHFAKQSQAHALEVAVLRCLERVMAAVDTAAQQVHWRALAAELDTMAQALPGTVPLLGLTEMQLWVQSKVDGRGLTEVFLDAVQANLAALG